MGKIRIARGAELLSVRLHRIDVSLVEQGLVGVGIVGFDPVDQLGLAHQGALGLAAAGTASAAGDRRVNPTLCPG